MRIPYGLKRTLVDNPGRLGQVLGQARAIRARRIISRHGASRLAGGWWYYSVELAPGIVSGGQYDPGMPMLSRMMLRSIILDGASCLDLGTMEGLMPVLMRRAGADRVLATDFSHFCAEKMEAVKVAYGADFEFKAVGLMYELYRKLRGRSFDLINCSGLLYHVWSPMMVLAGIRPLLKRKGLMIVSTNVVLDATFTSEFNAGGRLQAEGNTFWYLSLGTLDYVLRYLRLRPLHMMYIPWEMTGFAAYRAIDRPTGYVSVLCRAVDEFEGDDWMRQSVMHSWEHRLLTDWRLADRQPRSSTECRGNVETHGIDLIDALSTLQPITSDATEEDSHVLRLSARS
jgi:2-polyprenyl-3-methyl-5-hydroxy-6-metoxy-1,4-benzoquinol methylase